MGSENGRKKRMRIDGSRLAVLTAEKEDTARGTCTSVSFFWPGEKDKAMVEQRYTKYARI
jgi:hypothetical protein